MAIITPNPLLGRLVTSLAIVPQTVGADGTLTDGTSRAVIATVESIRKRQSNDTESVTGITQRRKNKIILETESSYTITGFLNANDTVLITTSTNFVNAIVQIADYVKLVFIRGGITETFYGIVDSYEENFAGKGKVEFTLEVGMIDPGSANPVQA